MIRKKLKDVILEWGRGKGDLYNPSKFSPIGTFARKLVIILASHQHQSYN